MATTTKSAAGNKKVVTNTISPLNALRTFLTTNSKSPYPAMPAIIAGAATKDNIKLLTATQQKTLAAMQEAYKKEAGKKDDTKTTGNDSKGQTPAAKLITDLKSITAGCAYKSSPKSKVAYKVLEVKGDKLIIQHVSSSYPASSKAPNTFAYTAIGAAGILKYAADSVTAPASILSPTASKIAAPAPAAK